MIDKIVINKISSIVKNVNIDREVKISSEIKIEVGAILAVKIINANTKYNILELESGRMCTLHQGDIIPVVLGSRYAMQGMFGVLPKFLSVGSIIDILNIAGVAGECLDYNPSVGSPVKCSVLGSILDDGNQQINLLQYKTIDLSDDLVNKKKIVAIIGSGMNSGKTTTASGIIQMLASEGKRIAVAKVTGVGAMKDVYQMIDCGCIYGASFVDCGIPSTCIDDKNIIIKSTKGIINHLNKTDADIIFLELGDGLYGNYGVRELLLDEQIRGQISLYIICANDIPGSLKLYQDCMEIGFKPDVLSGAVTDNVVGINIIKKSIDIEIFNAIKRNSVDGMASILEKVL